MKWNNLSGVSDSQIKERIKSLEEEISNSPDADPRDAFEIRHWKEEIDFLKTQLNQNKDDNN